VFKQLIRVGAAISLVAAAIVLSAPAEAAGGKPTFTAYTVTDGTNPVSGGEPTLGYDPVRNAVIFGASAHETRMVFDTRNNVTQTNVSAPTAQFTLDSFTFTDQHTGRTFDTQLLAACSGMSFTDDAGANWTPSTGCGVGTLLDHESVGGGPFHAPLPAGVVYPDAVYYCAQNGLNAS